MKRLPWILLLLAGGAVAADATDTATATARERIAAERAAANALFAERERACQRRFVVTACVDAARAEQREVLTRLRREEGALDEAQRRQRAAERNEAIRAKVAEDEAREQAPPKPARPPSLRTVTPRAAATPRAASAPAAAASDAEREAEEARKRARYEARQRDAALRRAEVERRAAERAQQGKKPAAPLPPADAASR